jgi:formamidopyrimidine-DNA glycosylase
MPELPEVETIARGLRLGGQVGPPVVGRVLAEVQVLWPRSVASPEVADFLQRLPGLVVADVYRRGKFICFKLGRDTLLIHLRMSGDLRVETTAMENGEPRPLKKHDRVIIRFRDEMQLVFNDARKFGRLWLVEDPKTVVNGLGPEPLDLDFTPVMLHQKLQHTRRQLKPLLLDQTFIAGLGNIYADEALHVAKLNPLLKAVTLDFDQAERLLAAIRQVLEEGIRRNGASIDWVYRGGDFQNNFRVYQRTGKPCPVCGTPIQRRVIGQRSTHYCPVCQPES